MAGTKIDRSKAAPWIAAAATIAIGIAAWGYSVDDAFVIARYARRLARGLGWTMNDGPPTDGVTGPLGIVPGFLGALVGIDPVLAAKVTGLACAALAAALVSRAASRHALGGPSALLVAGLASCNATVPIWGQAGLETGMATLAATLAALAVIARPRPIGWALGGSIAALAWLRPETAVLALALLAACASRDRRQGTIALAIAALGAASVIGWRTALFGTPFPLAWDAKPGEVVRGLGYVARAVVVVTGLAGIVLVQRAARRSRTLRALAFALGAHVVTVALAGGDWMPGFRLIAPIVPSFALVAGIGGARAIALSRGRRRALAIGLVALAVGVPAVDAIVQIPRAHEAGETRERVGRPLAVELARLASGSPVALVDVGFLPWVAEVQVVDLGGITDPSIGRGPGRHLDKLVSPEMLAQRGVTVVVLRSFTLPQVSDGEDLETLAGEPVERRLAASAWVRDNFRVDRVVRWSDGYFYVVLVRG